MGYKPRWGAMTWIPTLQFFGILGVVILLISFWGMGAKWHTSFYTPLLGYYVLASICQSHYFRGKPEPNKIGYLMHVYSIIFGTIFFFLHKWFMVSVLGIIDPKIVMYGQFTFIVFGFFFYGWDDFMFNSSLSAWLKKDLLKAIFWYFFIWILWFIFFAMPGGPGAALGQYQEVNVEYMLGCSQWVIIMSLMIAITWKDYIATFTFPSNYIKGLILFIFSVAIGFLLGSICYSIVNLVAPSIPEAAKWHHVLYMGTYPLIPLILFGLYTNHFNGIAKVSRRALLRTVTLLGLIIIQYLIFRFIIAPSGFLGNAPWYHHQDLVFNFTIAVLALAHHWFNGRIGFLVKAS